MKGAEHMIRRAEYRKENEAYLFQKVIEWATAENELVIVEIVERAFADDNAENWLTLHPASSFTGLTKHYFEIVAYEKEIIAGKQRLLKKKLDAYYKKLIA